MVKIIHGDCLEVLKTLPDNSVDAIVTDPPYGIGVAKWDVKIDVNEFTLQAKRILKKEGFYCFFGQMPTILNWMYEAQQCDLKYREQIVWVKRIVAPSKRLHRMFELICIYGGKADFYKKTGKYEDVKFPGILVDTFTIEGFQRAYSAAISLLNGNSESLKRSASKQTEFQRFSGARYSRAPEEANFTNVWSFLSPSFSTGRVGKKAFYHPTEKPLEIMLRLIEMLCPENGIVLDPFAGSGTTGLACKQLQRNCILIEKESKYIKTIEQRIAHVTPTAPTAISCDDSDDSQSDARDARDARARSNSINHSSTINQLTLFD